MNGARHDRPTAFSATLPSPLEGPEELVGPAVVPSRPIEPTSPLMAAGSARHTTTGDDDPARVAPTCALESEMKILGSGAASATCS
jgi:hypothetical protein